MNKFNLIYDFFRLWIKWRDWREAWEDAKFMNDKKIQREMEEIIGIEEMLEKLNKEDE